MASSTTELLQLILGRVQRQTTTPLLYLNYDIGVCYFYMVCIAYKSFIIGLLLKNRSVFNNACFNEV